MPALHATIRACGRICRITSAFATCTCEIDQVSTTACASPLSRTRTNTYQADPRTGSAGEEDCGFHVCESAIPARWPHPEKMRPNLKLASNTFRRNQTESTPVFTDSIAPYLGDSWRCPTQARHWSQEKAFRFPSTSAHKQHQATFEVWDCLRQKPSAGASSTGFRHGDQQSTHIVPDT